MRIGGSNVARETPMRDEPEMRTQSTHEPAHRGNDTMGHPPQLGPLGSLKRGARRLVGTLVCGASQVQSESAAKVRHVADPERVRHAAAQTAREATDPEHPLYLELSAAMCWDAVKHCAVRAGALTPSVDAQHGLVSVADGEIRGRDAMEALPAAHAVGFFDGNRLVHLMISLGHGHAAGNKNDCIGMGHSAGWEALDLKRLKWNMDGGITAPGLLRPERTLVVRSRLLGSAAA